MKTPFVVCCLLHWLTFVHNQSTAFKKTQVAALILIRLEPKSTQEEQAQAELFIRPRVTPFVAYTFRRAVLTLQGLPET